MIQKVQASTSWCHGMQDGGAFRKGRLDLRLLDKRRGGKRPPNRKHKK